MCLSLSLCSVTSPLSCLDVRALPLHDPELSACYWLSLDFPFISFSRFPWCPGRVPSIPFNSPFMSLSFSRYVRFIFHVCPVLSLRVMSLHLPSCRLVSLSFVSLSFPLHSPCFHFCPFHVPFSSPLFPFHFPLLSCHVDSPHFLALPCIFPLLPSISQNTLFFQHFRKEGVKKHRVFPDFRQKEAGNPNQQRGGRGIRAWEPCFPRRLRFSGTSSNYRAVRGGTP